MTWPLSVKTTELLPGSVSVERKGRQRVLCLSGEVDFAVVNEFERNLDSSLAVDEIDAGAVTYFGSSGIRLLVRVRKASLAEGCSPKLRSSSMGVDRVLALTGVLPLFQ